MRQIQSRCQVFAEKINIIDPHICGINLYGLVESVGVEKLISYFYEVDISGCIFCPIC